MDTRVNHQTGMVAWGLVRSVIWENTYSRVDSNVFERITKYMGINHRRSDLERICRRKIENLLEEV
jgi:hypothetical protein